MARGNDSASAEADLHRQYGVHGNAEQLIAAQRASVDPTVSRASLLAIDGEKTDELDLGDVASKLGDKVGEGEEVLSAAVRGHAIVAVVQGTDGRTRKEAAGADKHFREPELSEAEQAVRARALADARVRSQTAALQAEVDRQVAERRAELEEELRGRLSDVEEQHRAELDRISGGGDGGGGDAEVGEPTPPGYPAQGGGPKRRGSSKDDE